MLSGGGKLQTKINTSSLTDGDSIAAYLTDAAGALITSTLLGGKQTLDTNVASDHAEDDPHVSGDIGSFVLAVRNDAGTSLVSADGDYSPLSVDANGNLRVNASVTFTAEHNEDDPAVSGDSGIFTLLVRQDTLATSTSADGDYGAFKSTSLGELYTADSTLRSLITALSKAEDAVHSSGDQGIQALAVRKDASGSNVSADGDYASLIQWSEGSLKVVDIANASILQQQVSVTSTAAQVPAANLSGRKSLMLQNTSSNKMWIGSATVTTSGATAGIELPANSFLELDAGPAVNVYAVKTGAGSLTLNVLEMA